MRRNPILSAQDNPALDADIPLMDAIRNPNDDIYEVGVQQLLYYTLLPFTGGQ